MVSSKPRRFATPVSESMVACTLTRSSSVRSFSSSAVADTSRCDSTARAGAGVARVGQQRVDLRAQPGGPPRLAMRPLLACSAAVNSGDTFAGGAGRLADLVDHRAQPVGHLVRRIRRGVEDVAAVQRVHQLVAQRHAVGARRIDLGAQVVVAAGEIVVPDGVGDGVQGAAAAPSSGWPGATARRSGPSNPGNAWRPQRLLQVRSCVGIR